MFQLAEMARKLVLHAKALGEGGVWLRKNPAELEDNQLALAKNVYRYNGALLTWPGSVAKGVAAPSSIMGLTNHYRNTGVIDNLRAHLTNLQRWVGFPTDAWQDLWEVYTKGTVSGIAGPVVTGSGTTWNSRTVDTGTKVYPGDMFYLDAVGPPGVPILTVDSDLQITLASSPGAGSGPYTIRKKFRGTASDYYAFVQAGNDLYLSQGVDTLKRVDGTTGNLVQVPPSGSSPGTDIPAAGGLETWAERIWAWHLGDYSVTTPTLQTVAWCVGNNFGDWSGNGSGFRHFSETPGAVQCLRTLDQNLIMYKERDIWLGTRSNQLNPPAEWDRIVTAERLGLFAPRSVASIVDHGHVYIGNDDFNLFQLFRVTPLGGRAIRDFFFQQLTRDDLRRVQAEVVDQYGYVAWLCPLGGELIPSRVVIWDYIRDVFHGPIELGRPTTVLGQFITPNTEVVTIDELVGTIDEQNWTLGGVSIAARDRKLLYGLQDGTTLITDEGAETFGGIQRVPQVRSKAARVPTENVGDEALVTRVVITYRQRKPTVITVKLSADGFGTILEEQSVTLEGDTPDTISRAFFDFIQVGERMQVEVTALGSPSTFELLELSAHVTTLGEESADAT